MGPMKALQGGMRFPYRTDIPCIFTGKAIFTLAVNKACSVNLPHGCLSHKVIRRLAHPHTPAVGGIAGAKRRARFLHNCARARIGPRCFQRALLARSESRASERTGPGGTGTASAEVPTITSYSSTIGTDPRIVAQSGRVLGGTANRCFPVSGTGLLVEVKAEDISQRRKAPSDRARLRQRSGLIAEVLLLAPQQERIQAGKLIRQTGLSAGLVSRLLHRLASLKLLEINGAGPNRYWQFVDRGGLLDLWAAEGEPPPPPTGLYVWTRSPKELIEKLALLDGVSEHWALGGAAAANVYAPTLTIIPEPTVWFDARVPAERVARAIGGEIVDHGANLWLWQSEQGLALTHATLWKPPGTAAVESGELRIVTRARAYIEALKEGGRSAEIAQNLREKILSYAH